MSAELRDQVQASLGSNFNIERELGGGGMSRVFLARDASLDRPVVVKVLSGEFTSGVSADRFRREIQLIARLQHPHIVPILSAGASEGGLYYTMPFFGGETLRARLTREGPMPIAQATRILHEILDALSFAHSHGVIHRDIKPENILLEAGHAVVADFGVAKALKESGSLTSIGMAVGTPAYMAPEQASADPSTDHRADLYSVGVIAYEMLSGAPPFSGSPQQMIRAHLVDSAQPLLQRRPDVPAPLAQMIMRTLEKDAILRPQSAEEMLGVVDAVTTPATTQAIAGTGVSASSSRRNRVLIGGAAVVVVATAAAAWVMTRPPVIAGAQSIAIAPFSVASGDTGLMRMGQNLVTTISANLDGVGEIRVADPMAVLSHARSAGALLAASDAMNIARQLGAKSVVQGTLAPAGENVRADAVLLDAAQGTQLARISVIAPAGDIAALTDSLTWTLLRAIWSRGRAPTPAVSGITTHSPASLREYLEGERLFARGEVLGAADAYLRALKADTTFWYAHYRYRIARGWLGMGFDTAVTNRLRRHIAELPEREHALVAVFDSTYGAVSPRIAAYRRVVDRYPEYAPAWVSLGDYLIHQSGAAGYDIHDAIGPWQQAVRLMPNDEESANHLAFACIAAEDTTCIRSSFAHYDSLVRSDNAPTFIARGTQRSLTMLLNPARRAITDSILAFAKQDSVYPATSYVFRQMFAGLAAANPGLTAEWDHMDSVGLATLTGPLLEVLRYEQKIRLASRGDFSGINAAIKDGRTLPPFPGIPFSLMYATRMRALAEMQGFVAPDTITAASALAVAARPRAAATARYDAYWTDGLSALLRNDKLRFEQRLAALTADTTQLAGFAARSLRAIASFRAGQQASAAESLLVLEHAHGESTARVWGAFSGDRLLAAQWLSDHKRFAESDSLLYFTRGFYFNTLGEAGQAIFAPAQLVRSRNAEGMGNNAAAVRFAQIFLNAFDKAPPSQQPLIDEAKSRIARLGIGDKRR